MKLVYDAYVVDPAESAKFYSKLFAYLIHHCQQTPKTQKIKLVFSIDELNDLIAPHGRGITKTHNVLSGLFEYNIRKLRKHNVRLIATTHRFNQLSINVRSQCDHVFIKRSFGYDIWDFMTKALITASNKVFWTVLKLAVTMPKDMFIFFDGATYDVYRFPDIPRPEGVEVEPIGAFNPPPNPTSKKDMVELDTHLRRLQAVCLFMRGMEISEIAKKLNEHPNTISKDLHYLRACPKLLPEIREALQPQQHKNELLQTNHVLLQPPLKTQ